MAGKSGTIIQAGGKIFATMILPGIAAILLPGIPYRNPQKPYYLLSGCWELLP
jgi:hypothetical protein